MDMLRPFVTAERRRRRTVLCLSMIFSENRFPLFRIMLSEFHRPAVFCVAGR
jgi:hypothetical protein